MPELPDVEVYRRYFDRTSLHQEIEGVEVYEPVVLAGSQSQLESRLRGSRFESTMRHGKYLFAGLDGGGWLVLHFGMTGYLHYYRDERAPEYTRALFLFSNEHSLAFVLQRKLGKVLFAESREDFVREQELGPDALSIDLETFRGILDSRGSVKSALMNQQRIAGIGNIYSDEILFQARMHPETPAGSLDDSGVEKLYKSMIDVLNTAIKSGADPGRMPDSYLLPHRRKGDECPVCGGKVEGKKISGRTSYFCPGCQK